MKEAIWRGHRVKVLQNNMERTVILTPCGFNLTVRQVEVKDAKGYPKKILKDSNFGA